MLLKTHVLNARGARLFAISATVLTLLLVSYPARMFVADYWFGNVSGILDDKGTEILDAVDISVETLPEYQRAIDRLKSASSMSPSQAAYHAALAGVYLKLGSWSKAMAATGAELPPGAESAKDAFEAADVELRAAISLEPTNHNYHFAMGTLLDSMDAAPELSEKEFDKAVYAYPVNALLRYAIAQRYFATGRPGLALEQARMLASIDDTYIYKGEFYANSIAMERDSQAYRARLTRSYLFAALDITWRVTKDVRVVKGIAPDTDEAREVVRLFIELMDIESSGAR